MTSALRIGLKMSHYPTTDYMQSISGTSFSNHFYSVETHLLDGYGFECPPGFTHEVFSDYKGIDGVLVPTTQIVRAKDSRWNVVYVFSFDSSTFNDIDPSVFALPPSVSALAEKQKAAAKQ